MLHRPLGLLVRGTLASASMALALAVSGVSAMAQTWPTSNVTILVPFAAGSTPDLIARVVAEGLQAKSGKTILVENRPGAGGNTATAAVAKAAPDGATLGVSILGPLVINPLVQTGLPYDPAKDLTPVTVLASQPSILAVTPGVAATSVGALLDAMRKQPEAYNYGSIGRGSLSHLAMEALSSKSGTKPVHVVFNGSPAAVTALMRGDVQMAIMPAASVVAQGRDGKVRMLAVTSPKRSPLLPDLPTMAEAGIAGVEADAWNGLIAPGGLPPALLAEINAAVVAVLQAPATAARIAPAFMVPVGGSPDAFKALLAAERARWEPLIASGAIKLN